VFVYLFLKCLCKKIALPSSPYMYACICVCLYIYIYIYIYVIFVSLLAEFLSFTATKSDMTDDGDKDRLQNVGIFL
jgi:hypothetical protein